MSRYYYIMRKKRGVYVMAMSKKLYDFITEKKHHQFRHHLNWNLAEEYAKKKLSPIERMADRFERLC